MQEWVQAAGGGYRARTVTLPEACKAHPEALKHLLATIELQAWAVEWRSPPPWTDHHAWLRRGSLQAWVARAGGVADDKVAVLPASLKADPAHAEALDWLTAMLAGRGLEVRWRP